MDIKPTTDLTGTNPTSSSDEVMMDEKEKERIEKEKAKMASSSTLKSPPSPSSSIDMSGQVTASSKNNGESSDDEEIPAMTTLEERTSSRMHAVKTVLDADADAEEEDHTNRDDYDDDITKSMELSLKNAPGNIVEPLPRLNRASQPQSNSNSNSDDLMAKEKARASATAATLNRVTPVARVSAVERLSAPLRSSQMESMTTVMTTDLERGDTMGTVMPPAPGLERATARSVNTQPGALRVTTSMGGTSSATPNHADDNLEYENAPDVEDPYANSTTTNRSPSGRDDLDKSNNDGHHDTEIAAELIDAEADERRLKETLEDVLKTQNAVHVVDVAAEDKLKRERQRRNMVMYVMIALALTIVVIVSVVVSVKNNVPTDAPTEVPSMSPTMAPTARLSAVQEAVLAGFEALPPPESPAAKAIEWLANEDEVIEFPIEEEDYQDYFNDRYASAVLAFSTNYQGWIDNTNWLSPTLSVCDGWKGLTCNDDGRVGVIDLAIQNLTGTIPTEIGIMDNLDFVFLFRNGLTGTLPTELGNLGDVDFFYLNENQLTGTLPKELSGLLDADDLFLFGNRLTGTIPDSFGDLVDLDNLYLNDNELSGTIPPSFSNLKQIKRLYLQNNKLQGNIPSELGGIISLERLLLSNNTLSGPIPSHLGSFLGLHVLTLQENNLTGNMPMEICSLTAEDRVDSLEVLEADCLNEVFCPLTCCTGCF